jgi:hypothetical protein
MFRVVPSVSTCSTNKRGVDFGGQAGVAGMACLYLQKRVPSSVNLRAFNFADDAPRKFWQG